MPNCIRRLLTRLARVFAFGFGAYTQYLVNDKLRFLWTDDEFEVTTNRGFKIMVSPREHLGSPVYFYRDLDANLSSFVQSHLWPGFVAIDVGAEKGWFSLLMGQCVGPQGKVLAFEPVPRNYQRLSRHIQLNGYDWVQTYNIAVSNELGELGMKTDLDHLGKGTPDRNTGLSHLVGADQDATIKVQCTTLDTFCQQQDLTRLDLIKIDVEGAERKVVDGARGLIERFKPILVIEYNSLTAQRTGEQLADLDHMLDELGYARFEFDGKHEAMDLTSEHVANQKPVFCNVVCLHRTVLSGRPMNH